MKLFVASLAIGLLIPALVVVLILAVKILYPGTTGMFMLWFFVWPLPLLFRLFPDLGTETTAFIAFAVGTAADIAIFSFLSHVGLRAIQRSKAATH